VSHDPNAKDRDVDDANKDKKSPFELLGPAFVDHDQGDTVGDDLGKKLRLNSPQ
jgi:hypothetical protein